MNAFVQDVRYAIRGMARNPLFTAVAVAALALGIGLNTAVFSIAYGFLYKPLPVKDPGNLVTLSAQIKGFPAHLRLSYARYVEIKRDNDVFDDLAAIQPVMVTLRDGDASAIVWGEMASGNYFQMLGVDAALGRVFGPEDDRVPGAAPVAVLAHDTWRKRFGGDAGIVGKTITLNDQAFTVIGVAPPEFRGTYSVFIAPEFWAPVMMHDALVPAASGQFMKPAGTSVHVLGRLKAGASVEHARERVKALVANLERENPGLGSSVEGSVMRETDARPEPGLGANTRFVSLIFSILVGLVLLVACSNVANMLLARAGARRREIAVRTAIGARRSRLVRQLFTESLVLSVLGAAGGLAVAAAFNAVAGGIRLPLSVPVSLAAPIDGTVLGYAAVTALLTSLVFGLAPALHASRLDLVPALRDDGAPRHGRFRLGSVLAVGQIAVSLVLLAVAGLFARSLGAASHVDLGLDPENLLVGSLLLDLHGYDEGAASRLQRDLRDRVVSQPGVVSAAYAAPAPFGDSLDGGKVFAEGQENATAEGNLTAWASVGSEYFQTVGMRIEGGRAFTDADTSDAPRVAIVNRTLAEHLWPGANPLGRRLRLRSPKEEPVEIVGVAQNGKYNIVFEPAMPFLYVPLQQAPRHRVQLLVRTAGEPTPVVAALRSTLRSLDPRLELFNVRPMRDLVSGRFLLPVRMAALFAGLFGGLALALAMIGLYGVMAFLVSRRTREIGVRMALGASRSRVLRGVVGEGMKLTAAGAALGLMGCVGLSSVVGGLLVRVSPLDPFTLGGVTVVLGAVALAACYVPARRASRVEPTVALRCE